ncbi:MAG: hypothetical protein U0Q16_08595 [Bryobacteraceae bacterium]
MHDLSRRMFLGAVAASAAPGVTQEKRYLLLDRRIVDRTENAVLRVCQAEKDKRNPLFGEDKPWEVRYDNLYANVRRDPASGLYQCWYSPFIVDEVASGTPAAARATTPYKPRKREMGVCYAESKDGIAWTKPELGLVEFAGSRKNNLVVRGPHGSGVFFDAHERDEARRFKMIFQEKGISGAYSPDGKHWSEAERFSGIDAIGDTHNNAMWAPALNKYVAITRLWDRPARQRLVGRTESADFRNWTKAEEVMRAAPGHLDSQTYAMPIFEYEGQFLGLLAVFHTPSDTVQTELAWSPDTVRWERVDPGSPIVARGEAGAPDSGCVYAAAPVFQGAQNEIRIYYGGSNGPHTGWRSGFFCLARLRPGRFAGFEAASAGSTGTVMTRLIQVTSANLRVNASAARGQLRVGVEDAAGVWLEDAVPIRTDETQVACRWKKGNLRSLLGREVRLVFELRDARIFGFEFA